MSSLLDLKKVCASYGPFRALFDVDLSIGEGQAVGLLGPNGAGKSTIARVISGLVKVESGSMLFEGNDVTKARPEELRRAGIHHIPEGRGVFASLSVEENLRLSLLAQPRTQRKSLLDDIFDRFEILGERRRSRAGTLSGGQQRLLALAPAFVAPPRLLVVDELSLGLAPNVLDDLYVSLEQLHNQGTTLLISEQQVDRVLGLVETAAVVTHGAIRYFGPADSAREALEQAMA